MRIRMMLRGGEWEGVEVVRGQGVNLEMEGNVRRVHGIRCGGC